MARFDAVDAWDWVEDFQLQLGLQARTEKFLPETSRPWLKRRSGTYLQTRQAIRIRQAVSLKCASRNGLEGV